MNTKTKMNNKSIALIIGAIGFLFIAASVSVYFLYFLPQHQSENLALEQRKLEIAQQEGEANLALELEKHNSALEIEKEKNQKELSIQEAELNRDLEADCQQKIEDLRKRFSNIEGGGHNSLSGVCEVNYRDQNGKIISNAPANNIASVQPSSVKFDGFNYGKNSSGHYTLTGTVTTDCEEISVTAYNDRTSIDGTPWKLTSYEPGDATFAYNISASFQTADPNAAAGNNIYIVTALCKNSTQVKDSIMIYFNESDL